MIKWRFEIKKKRKGEKKRDREELRREEKYYNCIACSLNLWN